MKSTEDARETWVKRGLRLNNLTISYNILEAVASIAAGSGAGSIALLGFGLDSCVEVTSSIAARWRLRSDRNESRRATAERTSHIIIGATFLALALYIAVDGAHTLLRHERPRVSVAGIVILVLSCIIMPILARAKRNVAMVLDSAALKSESRQTDLCAYLSFIALGGVVLNAAVGWWWADPVAAFLMVPIIVMDGVRGLSKPAG